MIRVPRRALTEATEIVACLMVNACDSQGKVIMWQPDENMIERHLLAMLALMSPSSSLDIVVPEDVHQTGMAEDLPEKVYTHNRSILNPGK